MALTKINLSNNSKLSKYSFTGCPDLTSIRVHNNFTMDNCLFTSVGNNPSLSIFNTAGKVFYYEGQYSTAFGSGGVVYEISNGGQNGKMISVEETSCEWGLNGTYTYAIYRVNGWENVKIMKEKGYFADSPAFVWCENYGTDWYLPALDELMTIYDNKTKINSTLQANELTTLGTGNYWTSTESDNSRHNGNNLADSFNFSKGYSGYYSSSKHNTYSVRAILVF